MQLVMTKRSLLLSILLSVALTYSGWLILQSANNPKNLTNQADTPDAFMINASYLRLDQDGNPHSRIYTPKMIHYAANDVSHFMSPHIIMYGKDDAPWDITSDKGNSESGVTQIHLHDNVKIHQPAGPNNNELTMTTTSLTIHPNTKTAETDQAVTIIQPGTVITSVGLQADLKKGEVDLLSQAKGIYEAVTN